MRPRMWFLTALLSVSLLFAAAGDPNKVSDTGFLAASGEVTVIVDTDAALHRASEKFIPLLVWVGHREPKRIYAGRASFSLRDPDGKIHALPAFDALMKGYTGGKLHADYARLREQEAYFQYAPLRYLDSRPLRGVSFFPDPGGAEILYDQVELPSRTYFRALLYFPNPAGASAGVYTLVYDDARSGTRVEVPFSIAWAR